MADARARQARIDIDALLEELQRALKVYKSGVAEPGRLDQLRYIQELASEVLELERSAASGAYPPPKAITRSPRPDGLAIVVGHTQAAQGAEGIAPPFPAGQRSEYPWNTDLANRMQAAAEARGIRCDIFFRDGIGIAGAYRQAKEWNPQATVELHFNASDGSARGTETLYKRGNNVSQVWAQALQDGLVGLYNRTGSQNRGLKARNQGERGYESVSQIHPSALIEPFFGDSRQDAQLGVDAKDRQAQALIAAFARHVAPAAVSLSTAGGGFWRRIFPGRRSAPRAALSQVPDYLADPHGACGVPEDYLLTDELKLRMRAAQPTVDTLLGAADGLYGYGDAARKYGIRQTVEALREVGRIWALRGHAPRLGIGDISKQGGGQISGHASHRKGIDIDIRPMTSNGAEAPTTYQSANYSRALTQELCDLIHANGKLAVQFILFNDAGVASVQPYPNHDNHLHVRHWLPSMEPALPLLSLGSRGPTVRELQRRLNFWIEAIEPGSSALLVIDGDFGNATHEIVVAFQRNAGSPQTGKVGEEIWRALPTHRQVVA